MKLTLPVAALVLAAANVQGADISGERANANEQALAARLFGVSWGWGNNGISFGWGTSNNQWGSSSASKSCYGATGKPWESWGQPGWYLGNGDKCPTIPKWDNGDSRWCSNSRYAKSWFCRNGSGFGKKPKGSPWNWGKQGGQHGWPRPCKNPPKPNPSTSKQSQVTSSSSTAAQPTTTATSTADQGTTSTTADQGTSITADQGTTTTADQGTTTSAPTTTTTDDSGSATTSTGPVVVPTGNPDPVCEDGYQQTYRNFTTIATSGVYSGQLVGATVRSDGYLTYGLADTPEQCLTACDNVAGCVFVASYLDVEEDDTQDPRHSGKYTCALYNQCVGTDKADNWGGQNDPNFITDSSGWCKSGACA